MCAVAAGRFLPAQATHRSSRRLTRKRREEKSQEAKEDIGGAHRDAEHYMPRLAGIEEKEKDFPIQVVLNEGDSRMVE